MINNRTDAWKKRNYFINYYLLIKKRKGRRREVKNALKRSDRRKIPHLITYEIYCVCPVLSKVIGVVERTNAPLPCHLYSWIVKNIDKFLPCTCTRRQQNAHTTKMQYHYQLAQMLSLYADLKTSNMLLGSCLSMIMTFSKCPWASFVMISKSSSVTRDVNNMPALPQAKGRWRRIWQKFS